MCVAALSTLPVKCVPASSEMKCNYRVLRFELARQNVRFEMDAVQVGVVPRGAAHVQIGLGSGFLPSFPAIGSQAGGQIGKKSVVCCLAVHVASQVSSNGTAKMSMGGWTKDDNGRLIWDMVSTSKF